MTATTQGHQRAEANGKWPDSDEMLIENTSPRSWVRLRDHFRDIWNDAYQQAWDDCRAGRDINAAVNPYLGEKL